MLRRKASSRPCTTKIVLSFVRRRVGLRFVDLAARAWGLLAAGWEGASPESRLPPSNAPRISARSEGVEYLWVLMP